MQVEKSEGLKRLLLSNPVDTSDLSLGDSATVVVEEPEQ